MLVLRRLKIGQKISLTVAMIVAAGAAITIVNVNRELEHDRQVVMDQRRAIAHMVADFEDAFVKKALDDLADTAAALDLAGGDENVRAAVRGLDRMLDLPGFEVRVDEAFVVDLRGRVERRLILSEENLENDPFVKRLLASLAYERPALYGTTKKAGENALVFMSAPLNERNSEMVLVVGVVMQGGGILSGFSFHPHMLGLTGFMELVDQEGKSFARTVAVRAAGPVESPDRGRKMGELVRAKQAVSETGEMAPGNLMVYVPMAHAPWGVVVQQSEEEAFSDLDAVFYRLVAVSFLLVGLAMGATWFTTRGIAIRAKKLHAVIEAVGRGDLETPVPGMGEDEVGDLARAFEAMRQALKRTTAEVELKARQVEEARSRAETDRVKSQFVASMSHQLRTPLTAIMGCATSMLREDVTWDESAHRKLAKSIDRKSAELDGLISKVLQTARIEGETINFDREPVLLPILAKKVISEVAVRDVRHQFQCFFPQGFPIVLGDAVYLEQVLRNLLDNAINYTPVGGRIAVLGAVEGSEAVVTVRDEGIGMPPEEIPKLFTRFHRADNETNRRVLGSGLGLYIVKSLVEAHGGRVWVASAEGEGSEFSFSLSAKPSTDARSGNE